MKKVLLIALAAAAAVSASAETYSVGLNKGTVGSDIPIDPLNYYSASQSLYTSGELTNLYTVNADGSCSTAAIKSVSVGVSFADAYFIYSGEPKANVKVYIQNSEATAFEKSGTTYQAFDYSSAICGTGVLEYNEDDEGWLNMSYGEADYATLTVSFDEPLVYEGNSLILTWFCESDFRDYEVYKGNDFLGWFPSSEVRTLYAGGNYESDAATLKSSTKELPSVSFTYDPYTIEAQGGGETRGEYTHFNLKNFDNPNTGSESAGQAIPINPDHANSFSQTLYTAADLAGLNSLVDGNVAKAEIDEITFKTFIEENYLEGSFDVTVYVENTSATEFPTDGGTTKWFEYSKAIKGTATVDDTTPGWDDAFYGMPDAYSVVIKLDEPIVYEGESLLLTWFCNSEMSAYMGDTWVGGTAGYRTAASYGSVESSDTKDLSEVSGALKNGTSTFLPTLKFGYTPVITASAVKPVTFENVTPALVLADENAMDVTVSFDIVDAAAAAPYEIKVNNTSIGVTADTHVTLHYLKSSYSQDVNVQVIPGEGAMANSFQIPAADIAALFPAPTATCTGGAYSVTYDAMKDRTAQVTGVIAFNFAFPEGANVPLAFLKYEKKVDDNAQIVRNASSISAYPEFAAYVPEVCPEGTASFNLTANNGNFAFMKQNIASVSIVKGHADLTGSSKIEFNYVAELPCYSAAQPKLTDAVPADATIVGVRKYANGYSATRNISGTVKFEGNTTEHVTLPDELSVVDHQDGTHTFFAPAGHTIYIKATPTTTEDLNNPATIAICALEGYEALEGNPVTLTMADYAGNTVHVYSADPAEEDHTTNNSGEVLFAVSPSGDVSGVADIAIDALDADAHLYDLRGVEIHGTPAPGVYISRQGSKVAKVVIR